MLEMGMGDESSEHESTFIRLPCIHISSSKRNWWESPCLEKVLYLRLAFFDGEPVQKGETRQGKQATFVGEASPTKLAPQERTFRYPLIYPNSECQ